MALISHFWMAWARSNKTDLSNCVKQCTPQIVTTFSKTYLGYSSTSLHTPVTFSSTIIRSKYNVHTFFNHEASTLQWFLLHYPMLFLASTIGILDTHKTSDKWHASAHAKCIHPANIAAKVCSLCFLLLLYAAYCQKDGRHWPWPLGLPGTSADLVKKIYLSSWPPTYKRQRVCIKSSLMGLCWHWKGIRKRSGIGMYVKYPAPRGPSTNCEEPLRRFSVCLCACAESPVHICWYKCFVRACTAEHVMLVWWRGRAFT